MKKINNLFVMLIAIFMVIPANAQVNVQLKLNNKLGSSIFKLNQNSSNNLKNTFKVSRLEYYVSSIMITHDGGKIDTLKNRYLIANIGVDQNNYDLGKLNLTTIEAIQFSIGVDKDANHKDPLKYVAGHPLAPRKLSMHWGWTAGYRFLVYEGYGGALTNQKYELHALGDQNYFNIKIPTKATDVKGTKIITLNADYSRILENINVNNGLVSHSEYNEPAKALENMRDYVFTSTEGKGNVLDLNSLQANNDAIKVYPNPSKVSEIIHVQSENTRISKIEIFSISGVKIYSSIDINEHIRINKTGVYLARIYDKNGLINQTKKIIIAH